MGGSRQGPKRDGNEDAFYIAPDRRFAILADGMGGHADGEVASRVAVDAAADRLDRARTALTELATDPPPYALIEKILREAVQEAHAAVRARGSGSRCERMGTTLEIALLLDHTAAFAHVGDSRAYLSRDGLLFQITDDHTVVANLIRDGRITADEAKTSPYRSMLCNAVGVTNDLEIDVRFASVTPGDVLLLCTDGITDAIDDDALAGLLHRDDPTTALLTEVERRGGKDDATAVVVAIGGGALRSVPREPFPIATATEISR